MAQLEAKVREARETYPHFDMYEDLLNQQLLARSSADTKFPYARDAAWCEKASRRLRLLQDFVEAWTDEYGTTEPGPGAAGFFGAGAPKPDGDLRVIPRL